MQYQTEDVGLQGSVTCGVTSWLEGSVLELKKLWTQGILDQKSHGAEAHFMGYV